MFRTDLDPVPRAAPASNLRALLRRPHSGDYAVWSQVRSFDGSAHCGDVVAARTLSDGRLAFVVVDFIGGGAPRSRRAFALAADLFALIALGESPQSAMRFADAALQRGGWEDGLPPLATVFAGFADPSNETLTYVAAAHETALLLAPEGTHRHLPATGPVAGLFESALFAVAEVPFRRGESLVVVTDGIPDCRDADGVFFGSAGTVRAATLALRGGHDPAQALVAGAHRHGGGANDAAALVVRRAEATA
jgi:serine phosphatase RsbU (regulator of sigma subunit)